MNMMKCAAVTAWLVIPCILATPFRQVEGKLRIEEKTVNTVKARGSFEGNCTAYGFSIADEWFPYKQDDFKCIRLPVDDHGLQYQTDIQEILLRNKNEGFLFCYAYRVVETPLQPGRNWGFMGIGSYGDNWYARGVRTTIDLNENYELTDWAPKNVASTGEITIGVSAGKKGGFTVSASLTIPASDFEVSSFTKSAIGHFETYYEVKGREALAANSVVYYGMVTFKTKNVEPYISVRHEAYYEGVEYHGLVTQNAVSAW